MDGVTCSRLFKSVFDKVSCSSQDCLTFFKSMKVELPNRLVSGAQIRVEGHQYELKLLYNQVFLAERGVSDVGFDLPGELVVKQKNMLLSVLQPKDYFNAHRVRENELSAIPETKLSRCLYEDYSVNNRVTCIFNYIHGRTLSELTPELGDPFSVERVQNIIDIVRSLVDLLGKFIERGVVYRDLKPSNIVCRQDSAEKGGVIPPDAGLIDLDTLFLLERSPHYTDSVATPSYMAPEQAQANYSSTVKISAVTDFYSLGCVIVELLEEAIQQALLYPFKRGKLEKVLAHKEGKFFLEDIEEILLAKVYKYPGKVREMVERLFRLIGRLVRFHPEERPQTGEEAMGILEDRA